MNYIKFFISIYMIIWLLYFPLLIIFIKWALHFNQACACALHFAPRLEEAFALKCATRFYQHWSISYLPWSMYLVLCWFFGAILSMLWLVSKYDLIWFDAMTRCQGWPQQNVGTWVGQWTLVKLDNTIILFLMKR